jgi:hypothetical protein
LEEVMISNSMNFGLQKAQGGKKTKACFWLAGHENFFTLQIFMNFSCTWVGLRKQLTLYVGYDDRGQKEGLDRRLLEHLQPKILNNSFIVE